MKQNKLSFESQNLVVDYISFKFQKLDNFTLKEIASYLFQIGFNSYFVSGRLAKPMKESILVDSKNSYEVLFVIENSYWKGTKLDFSGLNGNFFPLQHLGDLISIFLEKIEYLIPPRDIFMYYYIKRK